MAHKSLPALRVAIRQGSASRRRIVVGRVSLSLYARSLSQRDVHLRLLDPPCSHQSLQWRLVWLLNINQDMHSKFTILDSKTQPSKRKVLVRGQFENLISFDIKFGAEFDDGRQHETWQRYGSTRSYLPYHSEHAVESSKECITDGSGTSGIAQKRCEKSCMINQLNDGISE